MLRKAQEKSDNYDAYLKSREEGFVKARGSRRTKKRKIIEPVVDENDAKKTVQAAT